jgi:hypothetical protein
VGNAAVVAWVHSTVQRAGYDILLASMSATEPYIPVTLSLKKIATDANITVAGRYDTLTMCDCIINIFIDLMGRITTRI